VTGVLALFNAMLSNSLLYTFERVQVPASLHPQTRKEKFI
jgi:hypothetical protein